MAGPLPALYEPSEIAARLQKRLLIHTFIDTGTWEGLTALWAAKRFYRVHTIEIDKDKYKLALAKFAEQDKERVIVAHLGDSRRVLKQLVPYVDPTTFFWLGARTEDDCPVLNELALIRHGSDKHIIMIDDIQRFQETTYKKWPSFEMLCKALIGLAFFVEGDVLTAFPHEYTEVVVNILHKVRGE